MALTRRKILLHALFKCSKSCGGLCIALEHAIRDTSGSIMKVGLQEYFPKFTRENAKRFGGDIAETYWWKWNDWSILCGRKRFLLWLIKEYWFDKTDCMKIQQEK